MTVLIKHLRLIYRMKQWMSQLIYKIRVNIKYSAFKLIKCLTTSILVF